jgi:hypothetical protein
MCKTELWPFLTILGTRMRAQRVVEEADGPTQVLLEHEYAIVKLVQESELIVGIMRTVQPLSQRMDFLYNQSTGHSRHSFGDVHSSSLYPTTASK